MVTKAEELKQTLQEVERCLKGDGLTVFYVSLILVK